MDKKFTSCAYHLNRKATAICFICKRPICKIDNTTTTESSNNDYCILCNAGNLNQIAYTVLVLFMIPVIGIYILVLFNPELEFFLAIIPIIIVADLIVFYKIKSSARSAKVKADGFIDSLGFRPDLEKESEFKKYDQFPLQASFELQERIAQNEPDSDIQKRPVFSNDGSVNCFECGTKITIKDKKCPSCGNSTKEEFEAKYF